MADYVGYTRVSTAAQAEGQGLDVQRAAITDWAKRNGHTIAYWCEDVAKSGSLGPLEGRQQLQLAVALLKEKHAAGMVFCRLDRLARDMVLQETLIREIQGLGAELHSCSQTEDQILNGGDPDDPGRVLVRQILGAVAQYERHVIGLRMRAGKEVKRARGGYCGGRPPYGWTPVGGELVPKADEQEVLRGIWGLLDQGWSLRKVADYLNRLELLGPTGNPWSFRTIGSIKEAGRRPVDRPVETA